MTGAVLHDGPLHDDPAVGFVRHHRFVVFQFMRHRHENGVDVIRLTVVFGRRFEQRHVVLVRELRRERSVSDVMRLEFVYQSLIKPNI